MRGFFETFQLEMRVTCAIASMIILSALPGAAASPAWNGSWKVNVAKSTIPGPSFTLTNTASGRYHMENGTSGYTFGCDGKDYPTSAAHSISCKLSSSLIMNTTSKKNGRIVRTDKWKLAAGGSQLTRISTEVQTSKASKVTSTVFIRTSGANGFVGGWTDPKRLQSHPRLTLEMRVGSLHIAFPEAGQYADLQLDGTDAVMIGPGLPTGLTIAIKQINLHEIHTTRKVNGIVINEGFLKLSADGRALTEEYWSPRMPAQRAVLVYDKQ